ncbi:hypothetical protein Tco_0453751 [Tanacetum coccineum]
MIASSSSRNSSKNMPRLSSNDMVHNQYLEEVKIKTQERNMNSKSSVIHSVSPQTTTKGSKPKPRSNNQTSRILLVSKSSCVTIMVVPKVDHSKNSSSFSDSKHFVCSTYHKCVFNANHDACITTFLKEVNSRATIQSNKTRHSNKPVKQKSHNQKPVETHGTSLTSQQKQRIDFSEEVPAADMIIMTSMIELESLFDPLFDEYFNGDNQVVSKSSVVTTADASDKRQQQPDSTSSTSTLATTVTADGNFNL